MESMDRTLFGTMPDGKEVEQFTLRNGGIECQVITYGGAIRSLKVPDRNGGTVDIVLGLDDLEGYRTHSKFFGALIGRYANRIKGGRFSLNGKDYKLAINNIPNHLHGGPTGFNNQVWKPEDYSGDTLTLSLFSADGHEEYPGNLSVRVIYRLTQDSLELDYHAECDKDTLCNLTNHTYFNLSGHDSGPVTGQYIQLFAQKYTPADSTSIPTGEIAPVDDTPMDLRSAVKIGDHIDDNFEQLKFACGYDHNWVLDGPAGALSPAAWAWSPDTGITLEVLTTLPGVQFYSGNHIEGCPAGKGGAPYDNRWGFCLETQYFPDSPNHANFPSALLKKGEKYFHKTIYRFGIG